MNEKYSVLFSIRYSALLFHFYSNQRLNPDNKSVLGIYFLTLAILPVSTSESRLPTVSKMGEKLNVGVLVGQIVLVIAALILTGLLSVTVYFTDFTKDCLSCKDFLNNFL